MIVSFRLRAFAAAIATCVPFLVAVAPASAADVTQSNGVITVTGDPGEASHLRLESYAGGYWVYDESPGAEVHHRRGGGRRQLLGA